MKWLTRVIITFPVHFARYRKTETRGLGVRKGVPRTWQKDSS